MTAAFQWGCSKQLLTHVTSDYHWMNFICVNHHPQRISLIFTMILQLQPSASLHPPLQKYISFSHRLVCMQYSSLWNPPQWELSTMVTLVLCAFQGFVSRISCQRWSWWLPDTMLKAKQEAPTLLFSVAWWSSTFQNYTPSKAASIIWASISWYWQTLLLTWTVTHQTAPNEFCHWFAHQPILQCLT